MNESWLTNASANRLKQSYVQGFVDVSGNVIVRNGSVNIKTGKLYIPQGDISMNGNIICAGSISLGTTAGSGYQMTVNGNTRIKNSILVDNDASIMSSLGVGKAADDTYPLDVSGIARFSSNVSIGGSASVSNELSVSGISMLTGNVGVGAAPSEDDKLYVNGQFRATSQSMFDSSVAIGHEISREYEINGSALFVKVPITSTAVSDVTFNVPTNLYTSVDKTNAALTNKLVIDTKNHSIKPSVENDGVPMTDVANGWDLGATGANSFNRVYGRTLEVSQNVGIGKSSDAGYAMDISGATRLSSDLSVGGAATLGTITNVTGTSKFTGAVGIGKSATSAAVALDISGVTMVSGNTYLAKSLVVGDTAPSTATLHVNASSNIATNSVVLEGPNVLFKGQSSENLSHTNYLAIDTKTRSILPYAQDGSGTTLNSMETGWNLGGAGVNRFSKIYGRDLEISTNTIKIEDDSGNQISMGFDATTGAVNYTVTTISGEVFVIKGVQTQKISSGAGTIDPSMLEFTGLSFGDTFTEDTYDLTSTFTYNLGTTTYTGNGTTFASSSGTQALDSFVTGTNLTTLLALVPTGTSVVINVGATDGRSAHLEGIDVEGSLVSLVNKIISVKKTGASTSKWTLWNSDGYQNVAGNFLHFIELKNINMASGTYFVAKTNGSLTYNIVDQQYLKTSELTTVNGDLYLYITRGPGRNWTKIPVSLPQSGSIQTQHMANSAITTAKLADNSVTGAKIVDGSIGGAKFTDNSITTAKIADGNVTSEKLADGSISGTKLATGAIGSASMIADGIITGAKLVAGSIGTSQLAASAVTTDKLDTGAVTTDKLADSSISTSKIADGAITSAKLAPDSVSSSNIIAGSITGDRLGYLTIINDNLAAGSITSSKLEAGAVTSTILDASSVTIDKIASGSVATAKIADLAITTGKLAATSVTTAKIASGAVTSDKLASGSVASVNIIDGAITTAKISNYAVTADQIAGAAITTGKIDNYAITDLKLNAGSVTTAKIVNDSITTAKIADFSVTTFKLADAAVGTNQIAALAVTSAKIGDSEVSTSKLAGGAVTTAKIGDAAVTAEKLATGSVTATKIAAAAVETAMIADGAVTSAKLGNGIVGTTNIADLSITSGKLTTQSVTTSKIADGAITGSKIADASITTAKLAFDISNPNATSTTEPGTYTGSFADTEVVSYNVDLGLSDNTSRISADALTLASCNLYGTSATNNLNRIRIHRRKTTSDSWPATTAADSSYNILLYGVSKNGFDMDSTGRTIVYTEADGNSGMMTIYDPSANRANHYPSARSGYNLKLDTSGNRVAMLNGDNAGRVCIEIYDVKKTFQDSETRILRGANITYSTNGTSWTTSSNSALNVSINKVHYSEELGLWMAVGEGTSHNVATSTDGITWTGKGKVFSVKGNGVFYKNGMWVAVGEDISAVKNYAYSLDNGATWLNQTTIFNYLYLNDVIYAFGRWWVCGRTSTVRYSLDGITWTGVNTGSFAIGEGEIRSFTFGYGRIYLGGTGGTAYYIYITNETTYTFSYSSSGAPFSTSVGVSWPLNSTTGILLSASTVFINKIAHAKNGSSVAVGFGGNGTGYVNISHSPNRSTWTAKKIFTGAGIDVIHDGTRWIATGEDVNPANRIQCSVDGLCWRPLDLPTITTTVPTTILNLPDKTKTLYSIDNGVTWATTSNTVLNISVNKVFYSPSANLWMAVGEGTSHTVATSTDGITWTGKGNVFNIRGNSVYYYSGLWMAVGEDTSSIKNVAYSQDNGTTWSNPSIIMYLSNANDVIRCLGKWWVCGRYYVYWSADGTTWNTTNRTWASGNLSDDITSFCFAPGINQLHTTNTSAYQFHLRVNDDGSIQTINANVYHFSTTASSALGILTNAYVNKMAYANGIFMSVGFGGMDTDFAQISVNIVNQYTYYKKKIFTGAGIDITYDGSKWIATGVDVDPAKTVQYSIDNGNTWLPLTLPTVTDASTSITHMITLPDKSTTLYSTNGGTIWNKTTNTVLNISVNKIHYCKQLNLWMAVGEGTNDTLATSSDGVSWIGKGKVFNIRGNGVYCKAGLWMAVGQDTNNKKNVAYSLDNGVTWLNPTQTTTATTIFTNYGNDVTYALGRWWLCGHSLYVWWSYDGITWTTTNRVSTSPEEIYSFSLILDRFLHLNCSSATVYWIYLASPENNLNGTPTVGGVGIWSGTVGSSSGTAISLGNDDMNTKKIAYANGYFIAVGFGGTGGGTGGIGATIANISIASERSSSWTKKRIFTGAGLDIVYDGTKWIATGEDATPANRIQYSTNNGTTWTPLVTTTVDVSANVVSIINIPDSNKNIYSMDGTNWIVTESNLLNISINKFYYSKLAGMWIAVGEGTNHTLATSTDGITWTGRGKVFNIRGNSVYYCGGRWVAVGEDTNKLKNIAYSTDGITWSNPATVVLYGYGNDVIYAYGRWLVCGRGMYVYWSFDGINWANDSINGGAIQRSNDEEIFGFTFISCILYLNAISPSIYYVSYNKDTHTVSATSNSSPVFPSTLTGGTIPNQSIQIKNMAYANGYTIAVGLGGSTPATTITNISISTNRTAWTPKTIFTGSGLDILYDGTKWIATGEDVDPNKRIQYSVDNGTTWAPLIQQTVDANTNTTTIINLPDKNKLLYSSDNGSTWTSTENSILNVSINKVYYSKATGLWVAVGEGTNHTLATSTDGITWTGRGKVFNTRGNSVYYMAGLWVAVGEDTNNIKNIAYSTDNGVTWLNPINTVFILSAKDVIYMFGRWFICGRSTYIYWSYDGITWNTANANNRLTVNRSEHHSFTYLSTILLVGSQDKTFEYIFFNTASNAVYLTGASYSVWGSYIGPQLIVAYSSFTKQYAYANGYTIAVGFGGNNSTQTITNISISVDRTTWSPKRVFTGEGISILYDGTKWIATGEDTTPANRIQYSIDNGATWAPLITPTVDASANVVSLVNIPYNNKIISSVDGTNLTVTENTVLNVSINNVHYSEAAGLWIAVGQGTSHTVATSTDGITWTGRGKVFNVRGNGVYYNAGLWVAVGEDTTKAKNIAYSTNGGVTWLNPVITVMNVYGNDIIYVYGRWWVCGQSYNVYWSIDGITWTNDSIVGGVIGRWADNEIFSFTFIKNLLFLNGIGNYSSNIFCHSDTKTLSMSQTGICFDTLIATGISLPAGSCYVKKMAYANGYSIGVGFGGATTTIANVVISVDRATWTRKKIFTGAGIDIVYDGTKWIATGEDLTPANRIQYSTDNGTSWSPLAMPTIGATTNTTSIVNLPDKNKIVYSSDNGANWTVTDNTVLNVSINKVYYSKSSGMWVAVGVGTSDTLATSTDGITWTGRGKVFNIRGNSVYHNGALWLAVGEDTNNIKNIAYSSDGITWSNPSNTVYSSYVNDVTYAFGRWFLCGRSTYVYWSFDGITWNTTNELNRTPTGKAESFSLSFIVNQLWVGSSDYTYNFITFDGVTTISYNNGADGNTAIWYSTLGSVVMPANSMCTRKLAHANGYTIAVGFGATSTTTIANVAISTTRGAINSWTQKKIFTGTGLDILYDGTKWIATGEDVTPANRIQYSIDNGTTWAPLVTPTIAASANTTTILSLTDKNKIVYSSDNGANWTVTDNTVLNVSINKVYYSKSAGMWVAVGVGTSDTLATSTDGITWTGRGKVFNIRGNSVYHNGAQWLAVGEDTNNIKNIAYSTDGITWLNPSNTVYSTYANDVIYVFGRWFLCGRSPYVYWSFDGITWNTTTESNRNSNYNAESFSFSFIVNQLWVGSMNSTYNFITFDGLTTISYSNNAGPLWYSTLGSNVLTANSMCTRKLAHANGYTIAVGLGATSTTTLANIAISISRGGSNTWTQKKIFTGTGLDILHDGSKWIATGEDVTPANRIQYSIDNGTTWNPLVTPTIAASTNTTSILSLPDKNKIAYSSDNGSNWTVTDNTVLNVSINKVYYSKSAGMWVAVGVGTSDTLATSTDGITWTGRGKVFNIRGNSVYHNGIRWLAVGEDTNNIKNIAYSTDGITWSNPSNTVYSSYVNDVIYVFGRWFLCGRSQYIYWSFDGITWNTVNGLNRTSTGKAESFSLNLIVVNQLWVGSMDYTFNFVTFDGLSTISYNNGADSNTAIWHTIIGSVGMHSNSICTRKLAHANGYTIAVGFGATSTTTIANVAISTLRSESYTWTKKRIFTGIGLDILYDGSKWIATGEDIDPVKRIQYSVDNGTTWAPLIIPTIAASTNTTSIIGLPDKNKIVYSTDNGTNWAVTDNTVLNVSINKVYYSKAAGMWVAVGEGTSDTLATSMDGITWTGRGKVFDIRGNSVYHNGVRWLAVGEDTNNIKNVAYSSDGITWSNPSNTVYSNYVNDVTYAFGRWFLCGRSIHVYWSLDGITWNTTNGRLTTERDETYSFSFITNLLFLNGATMSNMYIGYDGAADTVTYYNVGSDSWIWSNVIGSTILGSISVRKMAYANGYTIAVGSGTNGTTYANIAITVAGSLGYRAWLRYKIFTGEGLDIIFDGTKWIATGEDIDPAKRIQYSVDNGTTWAPLILPTIAASTNTTSIISLPDKNKIVYSTANGTSWTVTDNTVLNVSINKVYYSKSTGIWVAVGEGTSDTLATSTDGITWTGRGKVFNIRGNSVYHNGIRWLAVGEDTNQIKNIAYSSDGITWSNPTNAVYKHYANDVTYVFGRWFLCGRSNYIYWSLDGITWNTANESNRLTATRDETYSFSFIINYLFLNGITMSNMYIGYNDAANTVTYYNAGSDFWPWSNVIGSSVISHGSICVRKMAYANGYTIAVGSGTNGTIYANIAITVVGPVGYRGWLRYKIFTGEGLDILYDGTKWIATGEDIDPAKRIQYSTDNGTTWAPLILPSITASTPTTSMLVVTDTTGTNYSINSGMTVSWTVSSNLNSIFTVSINKIYYSETANLWMAAGEGASHNMATSSDGITWTGIGKIFSVRGKSVHYKAGVWFAVGQDSSAIKNVAYSSDSGTTWSNPSITLYSSYVNDTIYAFGRWFVCGKGANTTDSGYVYWSVDGTTWNTTNRVAFTKDEIFGFSLIGNYLHINSTDIYASYITYASDTNIIAAVPNLDGNYAPFAYNNGTITMTAATIYVKKMAYANGYTIAVGYGGMTTSLANISIATDRYGYVGWSVRKKIFTGGATDIIYDGTKWIATGEDTDPTKRVQYSIDNGTTWAVLNLPTMTASAKITLFTVPSFTNTLFTVPTFKSTLCAVPMQPNVSFIAPPVISNTLFTAPITSTALFNQPVQTNITLFTAPTFNMLYNNIGYRSQYQYAPVTKPNSIQYSYKVDNKSRTLYNCVPTNNLHKIHNIAPANIVAMGTGTNTMSYSRDDGLSWIGLGTSIFSIAGNRVFNNDSLWVAVGEGAANTLAISTDGINWAGKGMIFGVRGKSVTYANGMWVAVGEDAASNKCIAYSTNNGVTWINPASSVISTYCNDVTYSDTFGWIVVGKGDTNNFATSPNCVTWTGAGLVMTTEINSVVCGGSTNLFIGGRDTNLNRCFLYNTSLPIIFWQTLGNWQGWTVKVDRVTFSPNNGGYYTVASNGTSHTLSTFTVAYGGRADFAKLSQTVRCGGVAQGPNYWISWGDNGTATAGNLKISTDNGSTWYQLNYNPIHTAYNDVYIKSRPNKLLTVNISSSTLMNSLPSTWITGSSNLIGHRHFTYKMAFSGDGTSVAVASSYTNGNIQVYKINYTTKSYVLDYSITGAGSNYYMGRDITLNYNGTVMAYSYGGDIADTATQQIPRVVVYSKTNNGVWGALPDVTLKGSDYYEYSDFIPVRKFIVGFGSTLKLDKEGTTLVVSSWKDYSWAGMRVFKKRSGTWLPYYTDVQSTNATMNDRTIVNDLDITDNGQIVTWNIAEQTYIVTIPNSAIYTNVKLAPMSGATAYLNVGQDTTAYDSEYGLASDWFNAIETNGRIYAYPKSTTLTHSKEFSVQARNHLSFYTGVALLDTALANDNNSSKLRMYIDNNGLVGIGKKSTIYKLDVNGSINASGGIYSSGNLLTTSDDRLKDNEQFIDNATSTIMKLRPEIYDKKTSFDATDNNYVKESGIIAQEVWYKTPELRHLVSLGTKVDGTKTVSEETKVPVNTLSKNADSYINEHGERVYTVAGQIVKYEDIQNESKFETVITQHDVPNVVSVKPEDIRDIVIGDDIQTDPDYAALGWGDTPASVNYIGLIPYLIKSIQELKAEIDVLKGI